MINEVLYQSWREYRDRLMGEQWDFASGTPSDSMDMKSAGVAAAILVQAELQLEQLNQKVDPKK